MMPVAAEAPSPAPQAQPLDSGKPPPAWVTGLAGTWKATGQLSGSTERETELLLLRVSASGELSGYVDDGDGDLDRTEVAALLRREGLNASDAHVDGIFDRCVSAAGVWW
eukprot:COSAG06_NODE_48906_length_329_cov_0.573913_1_plen_109_part_11